MNRIIEKIYRTILRRIHSGFYAPGSRLPLETELAGTFTTNRMNAKRALEKLAGEGLVVRIRHKGTFVSAGTPAEKAGKLLKLKTRHLVCLFSAHPTHIHWNAATLREFRKCAGTYGFQTVFEPIPIEQGRAAMSRLLRNLAQRQPDGLMLFPDNFEYPFISANSDLFKNFRCPFFSLNRTGVSLGIENIASLDVDHYGDGVQAAELLIANGCTRILFYYAAHLKTHVWFQLRREGLIKNLALAGIQAELFESGLHDDSRLLAFLDRRGPESLLLPVNNDHAENMVLFLERNRKMPERDYRMLTFDDNPQYAKYKWTSFAMDTEKLGRLAAELLCKPRLHPLLRRNCSLRLKSVLNIRNSFRPEVLPAGIQPGRG